MNVNLEIVLIVLGATAVVETVYATVKMLVNRHQLYEKIKAQTGRLAPKKETLSSKWETFYVSTRIGDITYVPPGMVRGSQKLRQEIDGKLEQPLRTTFMRRAGRWFVDNKARVLEKTGPADLVIWLVWHFAYWIYSLVNLSVYPLVLAWPSHTMRRLNRRLEYLQGLELELDAAIKSAQELTRVSKLISDKRALKDKEKAEAKRKADEAAKKRQMLEEIRRKLVEAVKFHLTAPAQEISRDSSLIHLADAKAKWLWEIEIFQSFNPDDSGLDGQIISWGENLSHFELVSVVEGGPALSMIQRHAERLAESETRLKAAEETISERLRFSAIEAVIPEMPDTLGKAQGLLVEAAAYWSSYKFQKLTDLANAADELTRQSVRTIEEMKRWEDIILAFDRKRADIKENETALAAYGVELPQTADWEMAVEILENMLPHVWAAYDWTRLNELNTQIEEAFSARAQEVNRRLDAEHNKRVAKGQPLPKGARRQSPSATPAQDSSVPAYSPNGSSPNQETGRMSIRYAPDPEHDEPLVWVRSKVTGMLLQVRQSMAGSREYTIVNP